MTSQDPSLSSATHHTPPNLGVETVEPSQQTARTSAAAVAPPSRRESALVALQHRDFRLVWAGSFVSQVGSQMRLVAVGVQMWDLTHSYAAVGMLGLFKLVPLLVLSLFGGVIADAIDRRRLLIITQSVLALTSAILAFTTQTGSISAWVIYGVSALGAGTLAFDNPARSALIPNLVPRHHLPNALSLNIVVGQVATIAGPMVAGLFLPLRTTGYVLIYWIDAISFGAVVLALLFVRTPTQQAISRDVSLKAALDGLKFLRSAPIIMSTMTLDFFATFFGASSILLPAFAEQVIHVDRGYWGWLYAAPAIGALLAGIVMSWLGNVRKQGLIVLASVAAYGIATIVFGVSQTFMITLLAIAGTGAADTVSMVMRQTIRQISTPDELRGRMTSVNMIFYMGGPQLGEMEAGLAASVLGLVPSIVLGGFGVLAAAGVIGYFVPSLRNYDRAPAYEEH